MTSPGGTVDADVHVLTPSGWPDLRDYVSQDWARRLDNFQAIMGRVRGPELLYHNPELGSVAARDGIRPGADPAAVVADVVEAGGADRCVLVPAEGSIVGEVIAPDDSAEIARAYNAYFADHWLDVHSGFGLLALISPHGPREAAVEIERQAERRGVVGIMLPLTDLLLGHRYFDPILAAAASAGLPIVAHSGYAAIDGSPPYAGGAPGGYVERHALQAEIAMSQVTSLVLGGALRRYPRLKVVFSGFGFSWLPHLLWRMDEAWRILPAAAKDPDEPPSAIVCRQIRLTIGQDEVPGDDEDLVALFRMARGSETVLYGSDYPFALRGARETPLAALPEEDRAAVYSGNALGTFGRFAAAVGGEA